MKPGGPPILSLLRVRQWHKNAVVPAGLLFSERWHEPSAWRQALLAALACCLASAAGYAVNDLLDAAADRAHPRRRHRPLAAGTVGRGTAGALAALCLAAAVALAAAANLATAGLVLGMVANTAAYSAWLKHVRIVDIFSISFNFVLRVLAGVAAVSVAPSGWILLCTFFLALFLAAGKRLAEFQAEEASGAAAGAARPVLDGYSAVFLRSVMTLSSGMAIVAYALYTILSRRGGDVVLTVPVVAFALLHHQARVTVDGRGEEPSEDLLRDRVLLLAILAWAALFWATSGHAGFVLRE